MPVLVEGIPSLLMVHRGVLPQSSMAGWLLRLAPSSRVAPVARAGCAYPARPARDRGA